MTTVLHGGPNYFHQRLNPGESIWISWGPNDNFADSAISITAHPTTIVPESLGLAANVLTVSNINVTAVPIPGPFPDTEFHVGCSITNNGPTAIIDFNTMIGMIKP